MVVYKAKEKVMETPAKIRSRFRSKELIANKLT